MPRGLSRILLQCGEVYAFGVSHPKLAPASEGWWWLQSLENLSLHRISQLAGNLQGKFRDRLRDLHPPRRKAFETTQKVRVPT